MQINAVTCNASEARLPAKYHDSVDLSRQNLPTYTTSDIIACDSAITKKLFIASRDALPDKYSPFITHFTLSEYSEQNIQLYLTTNGKGGFGISAEGELVSVFSQPGQGYGSMLVKEAIRLGARWLQCFNIEGGSANLYKEHGFEITSKIPWNKDLAPKDWNYNLYGTPDIVIMTLKDYALPNL